MPSLFIILEREIPGLDTYVNGHALSTYDEKLTQLAEELRVTPLPEFFSMDAEEAAEMLEEMGGDPSEMEIAEEAWFEPAEGLKTIETLQHHLQQNPAAVPDSDAILADLREWHAVLTRAQAEGVRWHSGVDI